MDNATYEKMIHGMCLTHRHDFGLLPANQQENVRAQMKQLFEHNIKPIIDSMQAPQAHEERMGDGVSSVSEYIALVEKLAETDARLINMAFCDSESFGITTLKNSTDSFEGFLRASNPMFIRGMSIEWRTYLIKLLQGIDDQYRDVATAKIILG
jgi:hypothetical protein